MNAVPQRLEEDDPWPFLPVVKYYEAWSGETAGTALREARQWLKRILLTLGTCNIPPEEQFFRFWMQTLGIQVLIAPDLRPHFLFSQQLDSLLPVILRELSEHFDAEEDSEDSEDSEESPVLHLPE